MQTVGPLAFFGCEMNVAFEFSQSNFAAEFVTEIADEAVQEVIRNKIAFADERVFTIEGAGFRIVVVDFVEIRIVVPQLGVRRAHVG